MSLNCVLILVFIVCVQTRNLSQFLLHMLKTLSNAVLKKKNSVCRLSSMYPVFHRGKVRSLPETRDAALEVKRAKASAVVFPRLGFDSRALFYSRKQQG